LELTRFVRRTMEEAGVIGSFALGGITAPLVEMPRDGLFTRLIEVQGSFVRDLRAYLDEASCVSDIQRIVDEAGYFYPGSRIDEFVDQVDVAELEREYRAQIEQVLDVGLQPTHLDSHCAIHTRREEIFEMTLGLAREYGVPLRAYYRPFIDRMRRRGYPANDHNLMDSYDLDTVGKAARYARMLRALPVGLSEWAVHPGIGNAELRAVEPSWRVRQTDFDFVVSQEARTILQEEGIILVTYRALRALWSEKPRE
jgi:predicted glycoside hydrolase/deacetylase ChbG (UPF0249 family)